TKALASKEDPVAWAVQSGPAVLSEHLGVQGLPVRRLDQDDAAGREEVLDLAQDFARVTHVLDQVQQDDQVEAPLGVEILDATAVVGVAVLLGQFLRVGIEVNDLSVFDAGVGRSERRELPASAAAAVEDAELVALQATQDRPEEAPVEQTLDRVNR